jgi:hypothetical protein
VTMRDSSSRKGPGNRPGQLLRLLSAGLLGIAAALLVSCGSSGKGLIPTGDAGPLQSDFEAVAQAAENGDGSCAATAEAIRKTEQDFNTLPATVDAGLRNTLNRGIANLRTRALVLCAQPLAQATSTSTSPSTTSSTQTTPTTPTVTHTTSTETTPTTTTPTTSGPGGGTPAPAPGAGAGEEVSPGAGSGPGGGVGGGEAPAGAGGAGSGGAGANGAGQEGGK